MAGFKRKVIRKGRWAGTWEFRLYLGRDPVADEHGEHPKKYISEVWPPESRRDPKHPPGERLAEKALAAWVTDLEDKGEKPGTHASVSYAVDLHLELLAQLGRSPQTLAGYRSIKRVWIDPNIGQISIDKVQPADLKRVHAKMTNAGLSNSRIRQMHAVVQGALGMTVEEGWSDRNIATLIKRPKQVAANVYCPEPEEVDWLFREAGGDSSNLGSAIGLGATLGRRLGELCAIRRSGVDFDAVTKIKTTQGTVVVPGLVTVDTSVYTVTGKAAATKDTKTHAKVTIPAGELALERLRSRLRWMEKRAAEVGVDLVADPFVLSVKADGSSPPRPDYYTKRMAELRDRLGRPEIHFHCLRHFHATYLIDAGVDFLIVAQRLGWADASMLAKVYDNHRRIPASAGAATVMGGLLQMGKTTDDPPALLSGDSSLDADDGEGVGTEGA